MSEILSSYLELATIEALETSCFLYADLGSFDQDVSDEAPLMQASVIFTGPRQGAFHLACDPALLPELASNMLGDSEAPHHLQCDALGELANIICGSVLPHLTDEPHFRIGAPVVAPRTPGPRHSRAAAALQVDGRQVLVFLDCSLAAGCAG